jgi:hypothetical protein
VNLNLDSILSLLSNPLIAGLVAAFLGPMLAGIPWLKPILNFVARLAGYELVPVVTPKAQARRELKATVEKSRQAYAAKPCDATEARYNAAKDEYAAIGDGTLMEKIKPYLPIIIIGVVGFLFMNQGGGCAKKPATTPAAPKTVSLR